MVLIPRNNITKARSVATYLANYFGTAYRIFLDTSGNLHVERELHRLCTFGTDTTIEIVRPSSKSPIVAKKSDETDGNGLSGDVVRI